MPTRGGIKLTREQGLGASIVVIMLVGLGVEVVAGEARDPGPPAVAGPRFAERALFCPPSAPRVKSFAVAASTGAEVSLGLEPARADRVSLDRDNVFVQELPAESVSDVVGYGGPIRASTLIRTTEPVVGEAAARCSDRASSHWYFAAGASTLGVDERLLIYNPFPDEAVVKVTFLTTLGEDAKGNLAKVPVSAKSFTVIRVNDFIRLERSLGVRIDAKRGRVVAWRMMYDDPDGGPSGTQLSLGAAATSETWFFPEGGVGAGVEERISLVNPNEEEASVTVSLSSDDRIIQPEGLVEIKVAPGESRTVDIGAGLTGAERDLGGVSVIVQSRNDVGIVAERTIRYDTSQIVGSASELGATRSADGWWLPPATLHPTTDIVVIMNPGSVPATIDLEIVFRRGASKTPGALRGRELPPGGRLKIGIGRWTRLETTMIRVTSSAPVVAERVSYSEVPNDVGAIMGFPL
jgi:hypothetical protein